MESFFNIIRKASQIDIAIPDLVRMSVIKKMTRFSGGLVGKGHWLQKPHDLNLVAGSHNENAEPLTTIMCTYKLVYTHTHTNSILYKRIILSKIKMREATTNVNECMKEREPL